MKFKAICYCLVIFLVFGFIFNPLLLAQQKTYSNSIGIEFVYIPAGSFMMGTKKPDCPKDDPFTEKNEYEDCMIQVRRSEIPLHKVRISKGFYLGKYEVTQEQWYKVMGNNPSFFKSEKVGGSSRNHPVEEVSWNDVYEFVNKLNAMEGTNRYRLPTEAEWEYAFRAGSTTAFCYGNSLSSAQANFDGKSPYGTAPKGVYRKKTMPVGSFSPNKWGLYDMHGNVNEWCQDWYSEKYYANSPWEDPRGPSSGLNLVYRGGGWHCNASGCRSAVRFGGYASEHRNYVGFRLALERKEKVNSGSR